MLMYPFFPKLLLTTNNCNKCFKMYRKHYTLITEFTILIFFFFCEGKKEKSKMPGLAFT